MNVLDHFGVGMCYISHITMSALGHSIRLVLGHTCHCWASSYDSLFLEIMPTLTGCSTTDIQSVIPFIYLHLFIWNLSFIMSTIVVFFVGQGTKLKCCSFKEVRHAICFFFYCCRRYVYNCWKCCLLLCLWLSMIIRMIFLQTFLFL